MDYLENQCVKGKETSKSCDYVEYEGQDLGLTDLQASAENVEDVS